MISAATGSTKRIYNTYVYIFPLIISSKYVITYKE